MSANANANKGVFSLLLSQLLKILAETPGWATLSFAVYCLMTLVPQNASFLGFSMVEHREIFVVAVTFVAYTLGDIIDKPIFDKNHQFRKWLGKKWLDKPMEKAQTAFGLPLGLNDGEGGYRVAKALAVAAGDYPGRIQVFNELAKFARSAALLAICLPLVPLARQYQPPWGFLLAGGLLFVLYLVLKPMHMAMLYSKVAKLKTDKKYDCHDLKSGIRLFFWDGELFASAHPASGKKASCP